MHPPSLYPAAHRDEPRKLTWTHAVSGYSPASEPSVCTIGATDKDDKTAYFTNYGKGLDLYGPGVDIVSLAPGGGTASMDGTSMATPHIAGLGAYFMSLGRKADGLCDYLKSIALKDVISGVPSGTANLLAQNDKASSS